VLFMQEIIWLLGNKPNADVYQYFRMTLGWFQMVEAYEFHLVVGKQT
jgi:hypothetical protein